MSRYNANNILDGGWHSDCDQWSQVQALATVAVGREIRALRHVMESVLANMQSLGHDGIHDVIRHEAKRVRRARKVAAGKRRARRLAKKAREAQS